MFTLHNGDCLQILPSIPSGSIDAIITDLPYGTTACKWDTVIEFAPMWKEVKRVLKPTGVFITTSSQPFTSALVMSNPKLFRYEWVWEKDRATGHLDANKKPLKCHENICVFYEKLPTYNPQKSNGHKPAHRAKKDALGNLESLLRGGLVASNGGGQVDRYPRDVIGFNMPNHGEMGIHPTQKPIALYEYLIKTYSNEGDLILDIAMGSGTTIEAAERTGRNSIGIEKDEGIFQSAVLRLKSFTPSNNRLHLTGGGLPATQSSFTAEVIPPAKLPAKSPRR